MELFNKEGHLTDEGLRAVVDGTLDEMGRLEASEHLHEYVFMADEQLLGNQFQCGPNGRDAMELLHQLFERQLY